jgi:predicted ABC-class ATPase
VGERLRGRYEDPVVSGDELERILQRIDGAGYRAYKDLRGSYAFGDFELFIDHVQGDPFAAPSKLRVRVPMQIARPPAELFRTEVRRVAFEDFCARVVRDAIREGGHSRGSSEGREQGGERGEGNGRPPAADRSRGARRDRPERGSGTPSGSDSGSGKSGLISIDAGGQEVLERAAVVVHADWLEARLEVGLPAAGRRVLGRQAIALLTRSVPDVALAGLVWERLTRDDAQRRARHFVECVENQESIRAQLAALGLVAFVGDGSILPRESGASDRPLARERAVPFEAPDLLRVEIQVPNSFDRGGDGDGHTVIGMGIPRGISLIVGGGYHGKSTLLRALERAVYPHIPGDGRERVVAERGLVKIRAEDGRRVECVDIQAFIDSLPAGPDGIRESTRCFSSDDASGSTSQAANILEAIEVGATGLLLDEDTSATNFMVRDARMQQLVSRDHEPITPFLDRVRELYDDLGVSTVLVMGGCGDYFEVADHIITMRDYRPLETTDEARAIARQHPSERIVETTSPMGPIRSRVPDASSFDASRGRRSLKIDVLERDRIRYGTQMIDLRAVEQLVDWSQTRAIGLAIHLATQRFMKDEASLAGVLDELDSLIDSEGLDVLDPFRRTDASSEHPGRLARPRRFEIAAAINRLRSVRMRPA